MADEDDMQQTPTALIATVPLAAVLALSPAASQPAGDKPPVARKVPRTTEIHGVTLTDDYFWLRDKGNPEVRAYLEAENAYTEQVMKPWAGLRDALYTEMLGRMKQTDLSAPYRMGGYFYYSRTEEGKQYPFMCRRKGSMQAPEEILLDLNALAEGHAFLGLGAYEVSDDARWLAYSLDTTGYRQFVLYVKDLQTGQLSLEKIERTGAVVWAPDNRTLFYSTEDPVSKRSDRIYRHVVGSPPSELVYEEKDELFDVHVTRSSDRRMIFIGSGAKTSDEYRYVPADAPEAAPKVVLPRQPGHEYSVTHYRGEFYITTNRGARNFRVVRAPLDDPSEQNWKPFVEHVPGRRIGGLVFFANHAVVSEREAGVSHLRVIDTGTGRSHRIAMDEPDYALSMGANPEFETTTVRFNYQSMVTPASVYDYDMAGRRRRLVKRQGVLGGYSPERYEARRIWAPARDGTKVPVSLVFRKGTRLDGTAPLLLYAYGSYGVSMSPTFSFQRLSLLDRGAIFAMAYIRGGGEMGEEWREQGRMMQKMNTFTDFIDCAEHLVKQRYTSADRLVIQGRSAGGLLVGGVVNMRPDLFKAAVAQVPFVDVINTMLDSSLPLTTSEYLEWGNPNVKPEFEYMLKYSPYDNIKAQRYPALLAEVSLNDSQVPYWEGAKFVARLRAVKTDGNPVLLKANMGAGHGGSSGRYDALREAAFTYSFILWQMGLAGGQATTDAAR